MVWIRISHKELIKRGNLRVEMHFAEALTATINVVMYAEFDNVIEIDRNRQSCLTTMHNEYLRD
jgi:hypothetical protein